MTQFASGWKITRVDATVEAYTDHDVDITVGALTYIASAGYVPSAVERRVDLTPDNQQVFGIIDNVNITTGDLQAGVYDGARIEIHKLNWVASTKVATLLAGYLGEVQIRENQYTIELTSIEAEFLKPCCNVVTLRCQADLGDSNCGFTLTADTGSITSITTQRRVFVDTALTAADGYYNGGKVTFTSGANNGRTMDVKRYVSATDTVELFEPLPDDFATSDTYNIFRGCDKTFETCRDTFSNEANFYLGFPYVPGQANLVGGNLE